LLRESSKTRRKNKWKRKRRRKEEINRVKGWEKVCFLRRCHIPPPKWLRNELSVE
jgi:hypothetical protein